MLRATATATDDDKDKDHPTSTTTTTEEQLLTTTTTEEEPDAEDISSSSSSSNSVDTLTSDDKAGQRVGSRIVTTIAEGSGGGVARAAMDHNDNDDLDDGHQHGDSLVHNLELDEGELFQGQKFNSVFNVIMMGDSGVGKTDLIGRLCQNNQFKTQFFTTIGISTESHIFDVDGERTKLQIWDPSGSERFRKVVTQYFPLAKGILFVYDVNYDKSFASVQEWIRLVQCHSQPRIPDLRPKCLIGNKCDVGSGRRAVSTAQGQQLAKLYGMRFFETSSITGENVEEAFATLCQDMKKMALTTTTAQEAAAAAASATSSTPRIPVVSPRPPLLPKSPSLQSQSQHQHLAASSKTKTKPVSP